MKTFSKSTKSCSWVIQSISENNIFAPLNKYSFIGFRQQITEKKQNDRNKTKETKLA